MREVCAELAQNLRGGFLLLCGLAGFAEQFQNLRGERFFGHAVFLQNRCAEIVAFAQHAQQQMLRADIIMPHFPREFDGKAQRFFGGRAERKIAHAQPESADSQAMFKVGAQFAHVHMQPLQRVNSDAFFVAHGA